MRAMNVRMWLPLAVTMATVTVAHAESSPADEKLETHKLTESMYLITGPGGNIAVLAGKSGLLIVDDQVPQMTPKLKQALTAISTKPVRFVINTHWHFDHTGGNTVLGSEGAVIVAHENVRKRLSTEQFNAFLQRKVPPTPADGLPVITFAQSLSFHFEGEDIDVTHVEPAHTDGDSIVYFRKANIIHSGDTFMSIGYPYIDLGSGGHAEGFVRAADQMLTLAQPKTRIIPGHGPVTDRAKLKSWRDMLATIRERIQKLVAQGKSLAEVSGSKPTVEFDAAWGNAFIKPAALIETIYKDSTPAAPPTPAH